MAKLTFVAVGGVMTGILSRLVGEELQAWMPRIREHFLRLGVKHLPRNKRKRFAEEWRSHINEVPGEISKLATAAGFLLASRRIASMSPIGRRRSWLVSNFSRTFDMAAGAGLLFLWAPLLSITAMLIKLESRGPVLLKIKTFGSNGLTFAKYQFRTVRAGLNTDGIIELSPTRVGSFLIMTYLDELPTALNVIKGDLSFSTHLRRMIDLAIKGNDH